jgi:hypothetical protein
MRSISERPTLYGSPRDVDGQLLAFAAVVLKLELGEKLVACLLVASDLVTEATQDVLRDPPDRAGLCDEVIRPNRFESYEALTRHARVFLNLLESHITRAGPNTPPDGA